MIEPLRKLAEADRLRSVWRVRSGDRVLEIGSGDGRFLARLKARGAVVAGIEPSAQARARSERAGIEAQATGVEDAEPPPEPLDALIAWHSLEHLDRPDLALTRAAGWVKTGGLVVIAVPNLASLQARIGADRWFHQDVPRHRTHFTADGARQIAERSGLEVDRVRHLVLEQNPLGMWQTLLNRLTRERDVAYRALKRDPTVLRGSKRDLAITVIAGIPLVPIAIVIEIAAALARRGGSVVIEAHAR